MPWYDRTYKNRPLDLSREVGRIHRDLNYDDASEPKRAAYNAAPSATPPVIGDDENDTCCCDRTVYVSKDGSGDFDSVQEAINYVDAYETPSASAPWVVYICPGEYTEDVVGADYVSLVGIGTKKDGARIIGVDGPTYTCPVTIHSVENVLFRLAVDIGTTTPVLIDSDDAVSTPDECHNFVNCQFEMTTESQPGELVRVGGTEITFEECDFIYDNTAATIGANTHNVINIVDIATVRIISCRFDVEIEDPADALIIIAETANFEIQLMVKDCRVKLLLTGALAGGNYIFYNAAGDGEEKYIQDNHIEIRNPVANLNPTYYITIPNAKAITVTSNNNYVVFLVDLPFISNIALTNTLDSHHDQFVDLRNFISVPYANAGTFNHVHSPLPGKQHISQHQDIDLPPAGSFYLPANQTGIVPGGWRILQVRSIDWMKGGTAPVAATYRYVPGVIGIYQVNAVCHFIAATVTDGADYRIGIAVNNNVVKYSSPHSGNAGWLGISFAHHVQLTAITDWINIWVWHTSGANQTARGSSATTGFSAHKVS